MATPCLRYLDAECFKHQPAWAKQAFAYRLVHLLTPKALTKRLPKGLQRALIAPGVTVPPGLENKPGLVISPGAQIPAGWNAGDPIPPGVNIAPGATFPAGWKPGDPLPPGVTLDPGATFPPGWKPGDPLPTGTIPTPTAPPGVEQTGATPPTYTGVWSPGPVSTRGKGFVAAIPPWFYDDFDTLDAGVWTSDISGDADNTIVSGQLQQDSRAMGAYAWLTAAADANLPAAFELKFKLTMVSGTGTFAAFCYTGTHVLELYWVPPTTVSIRPKGCGAYTNYTVGALIGSTDTWKIQYNGTTFNLLRGSSTIASAFEPCANAFVKGQREISVSNELKVLVDDYTITPS